ncbi:MAG: DUF2817 domain-containing protein [Flavobacteriaceae bacterium]|jgi:hypothetical protein|nr:DUF2817 domain-containing protein [Flavobacteriaceae bacterium]
MVLTTRYFPPHKLLLFLSGLSGRTEVDLLGKSVKNSPIYGLKIGSGVKKILIWSQMHGNETTCTRALCRLIKLIEQSESYLKNLRFLIIPQLNPDGAKAYSRFNANQIDINRDALKLSQPESKVLNKVFTEFKPDYCFNMHDQRSVFSAGDPEKAAVISFLSPAMDDAKTISDSRKESMLLIADINKLLQKKIPGQVGRYNDRYNAECFGDNFSKKGAATILFEAGHSKTDYSRSFSKDLMFLSLKKALNSIINKSFLSGLCEDYFKIPENNQKYVDVIINNATVIDQNLIYHNHQLAIQYDEVLKNKNIFLQPTYHSHGKSLKLYSHSTINLSKKLYSKEFIFKENEIVDISFFPDK